ncbi:hypothetical protein HN371_27815 [Candidatus Poribacteria bacterium]|jgi:predicted ATPase|nr:hypothetical protein [Candidatus Poribacteria bacterium]MBT5532634.1 hypothetical protein [Candidatus Poribacteria bacterium]MBT7807475.1 hypothetical protein [Candidatus Poribacteria bacterium]
MPDKDGQSTRLEMAHVLFMDLVGYSRLSVEEQGRRIGALQDIVRDSPAYREAETEETVLAHPAGDGMALAFFRDPSSPARCALEVAGAVDARDDLPLRMGIHSGPVHRAEDINHSANVRGPGINLAQRVMDCGAAGHILLSYASADALAGSEIWERRLHDIGEAEVKHGVRIRLYNLTDGDLGNPESPGKVGDTSRDGATDSGRHNLPSALTSLIGREDEIQEVKGRLLSTRLLTLTGTGGAGKTRLSMRVGEEMLADFPDGVWFVELAAVSDPDLIPIAVAAVLDVQGSPEQLLLTTIVRYLDGQQALIVLDNCEHLIEGAAGFARDLLQGSRGPRILATSRELLGVNGETTWRVRSLSAPAPEQAHDAATIESYEAVRLFVERAQAVRPEFALTKDNAPVVAAICRRVDGIPLALELAAARVRAMSIEQIHDRLDERFRLLTGGGRASPRRQQTLAALVDWSVRLLDEDQQALFCRLAVFMGGFTAEAAEAVGAFDDVDAWDVLDLLMQLVDKSLVVVEESASGQRYRMLETLREYGLDRALETGQAHDARRCHAEYFAAWVAELVDDCRGPREVETVDRMEEDHDNIRQALLWLLDSDGDVGVTCALAHHLRHFWDSRGHHTEAQAWRTRALDVAEDSNSEHVALVRADRAVIYTHTMHLTQAQEDAEAAVSLSKEAGHAWGVALGVAALGAVALKRREYAVATRHFESALRAARRKGAAADVAHLMHVRAWVTHHTGAIEQAWELAEEALDECARVGVLGGQAMCILLKGVIRVDQQRYAEAQEFLDKAWELHVHVKSQDQQAWNLFHRARIAIAEGDYVSAYSHAQAYVPLARRLGRQKAVGWALEYSGKAAAASGQHATAADHYHAAQAVEGAERANVLRARLGLFDVLCAQGNMSEASRQLAMTVDAVFDNESDEAQARCVEAYGRLAEHAGDYVTAARLLASAAAWRDAQPERPVYWGDRSAFWLFEASLAQETRERVEAALSVDAFAAAWNAGRSLTLPEARRAAEPTLGARDAG